MLLIIVLLLLCFPGSIMAIKETIRADPLFTIQEEQISRERVRKIYESGIVNKH